MRVEQTAVFMLLAGALALSALMLGAIVNGYARRWSARGFLELPYVLDSEDATRFDQIVTAILADDPGFAIRCRELFERGE